MKRDKNDDDWPFWIDAPAAGLILVVMLIVCACLGGC